MPSPPFSIHLLLDLEGSGEGSVKLLERTQDSKDIHAFDGWMNRISSWVQANW